MWVAIMYCVQPSATLHAHPGHCPLCNLDPSIRRCWQAGRAGGPRRTYTACLLYQSQGRRTIPSAEVLLEFPCPDNLECLPIDLPTLDLPFICLPGWGASYASPEDWEGIDLLQVRLVFHSGLAAIPILKDSPLFPWCGKCKHIRPP